MSPLVYRIGLLLQQLLVQVPVGTNLALYYLLWSLASGRFLLSRGALFPALADLGLPPEAVRRSGAARLSSAHRAVIACRNWLCWPGMSCRM